MSDPKPVTTCECGYPLFEKQACPECGREFKWPDPKSKSKLIWRWLPLTLLFISVVFFMIAYDLVNTSNRISGLAALGAGYEALGYFLVGCLFVLMSFIVALIRFISGHRDWPTKIALWFCLAAPILYILFCAVDANNYRL